MDCCGTLGYKKPNEYDEYSRGIGCEKGAINRVVVVKKLDFLNYPPKSAGLTDIL